MPDASTPAELSAMDLFIQGLFRSVPTLPISTEKTHVKKPETNTDIAKKMEKYLFCGDLQSAGQGNICRWDSYSSKVFTRRLVEKEGSKPDPCWQPPFFFFFFQGKKLTQVYKL